MLHIDHHYYYAGEHHQETLILYHTCHAMQMLPSSVLTTWMHSTQPKSLQDKSHSFLTFH